MATSTVDEVSGRRLSPKQLMRFAQVAVFGAAVFTGINLALKVPVLAKYPGTEGNPAMRTLAYTVAFATLLVLSKLVEVWLLGTWIERKVGRNRPVDLRQVFHREIRTTAIIGGVLAAVYGVLLISLVPVLAPTALAAARACVVLVLVVVEIMVRVLPRGNVRFYLRLGVSLAVTLIGAGVVIFAGGFDLFPGESSAYAWVFILLIGPGNLALALAELAELRGVKKDLVSAPVYTMARFIYYFLASVAAAVGWAVISGGWTVMWHTFEMCWDRMGLLIPLAILGSLADLVRICVKTVVSATYMYIVGSLSVAIDAVVQTVAKWLYPEVYTKVHDGWLFPLVCLGGGVIVWVGAILYPHRSDRDTTDTKLLAGALLPTK